MQINKAVKFIHVRAPEIGKYFGQPLAEVANPRGGATIAYVQDGDQFLAAVAYCNAKDNFNYAYGRNKAAGRLIQLGAKRVQPDNHKYFSEAVDDDFPIGEFADGVARAVCEANGYFRRVRAKA